MRQAVTGFLGLVFAAVALASQAASATDTSTAATAQKKPAAQPAKPTKATKPTKAIKKSSSPQMAVSRDKGRVRVVYAKRGTVTERLPSRPSMGQLAGLHRTTDELDLKSAVALVVDQDTNEVLFEKNPNAILPIASISKLMTALVTVEAGLPMDERLTVTTDELVRASATSRLRPGTQLDRRTALHLALMSSENRAAHLLGRTYPGGMDAFVAAMNAKALMLGMNASHFVEPTGLSSDNQSSPNDLVRLVKAAYEHPVIREYSTSNGLSLPLGKRTVSYNNTNRLTSNADWDIGLQKTGYITAAGRCLVMQSVIEGKRVVMVLLDSVGSYSRIADAQRIRTWLLAKHDQAKLDAAQSQSTVPQIMPPILPAPAVSETRPM